MNTEEEDNWERDYRWRSEVIGGRGHQASHPDFAFLPVFHDTVVHSSSASLISTLVTLRGGGALGVPRLGWRMLGLVTAPVGTRNLSVQP